MDDEPPTVDELRRRQLAQERAERRELSSALSDADADKHERRADKAGYLRHKLEEQAQADRDDDPE